MHRRMGNYRVRVVKKVTKILLNSSDIKKSIGMKEVDSCLHWMMFLPFPLPSQDITSLEYVYFATNCIGNTKFIHTTTAALHHKEVALSRDLAL